MLFLPSQNNGYFITRAGGCVDSKRAIEPGQDLNNNFIPPALTGIRGTITFIDNTLYQVVIHAFAGIGYNNMGSQGMLRGFDGYFPSVSIFICIVYQVSYHQPQQAGI